MGKRSQVGVGADVMVQPPGSSALAGMSGAPISVKLGDVILQVPHVTVASPVIWAFSQKPLEIIYGIDMASFDQLAPQFVYLSGGPFQGPNDVSSTTFSRARNIRRSATRSSSESAFPDLRDR